jgi:hypothetical protein
MESGQRPAATKKAAPAVPLGGRPGRHVPRLTREGAGVPRPSPGHALLKRIDISQAFGFDRLVAKVQLARALRQTKTNPPRAASSPAARRLKSRRRLASAQPSGGNACRLLAPLRRQVRMSSIKRFVFGGQFRRDTLTFKGLPFLFFFSNNFAHEHRSVGKTILFPLMRPRGQTATAA